MVAPGVKHLAVHAGDMRGEGLERIARPVCCAVGVEMLRFRV